jgi:predicted SAM-dependent methyltransferase
MEKLQASKPKFLNIACGAVYVDSREWENVDYISNDSRHVRKMNVLKKLNPSQGQYEAIYCSHFVEHIPLSYILDFLKRCYTLTKPGGILRIVLPDAEFLLREYLRYKDSGNRLLADFAFVNFLDQCVRRKSGGRLGEIYFKVANGELHDLENYLFFLNGSLELEKLDCSRRLTLIQKIKRVLSSSTYLTSSLENYYIRAITRLLPHGFRVQNISFADIGELHHWMYDFDQISTLLKESGFSKVERMSFNTSNRTDGIFHQLDIHNEKPRKGNHQLFVEAYK